MSNPSVCDGCSGNLPEYPIRFSIITIGESGTEFQSDFACCHGTCAIAVCARFFGPQKEVAALQDRILDLERDLRQKEDSDRL